MLIEVPTVRGLPPYDASDVIWGMDETFRKAYVRVKHSVAKELQPQRICEIGVYSGIAAMCFLDACPHAEYVGIDNLQAEANQGVSLVIDALDKLVSLGYNARVNIADSQSMVALPDAPYDLVHVDADHSDVGTSHDVFLAWHALLPGGYILVDNGHDANVCAGTFDALALVTSELLDWLYLNEGVGSILIRKGRA